MAENVLKTLFLEELNKDRLQRCKDDTRCKKEKFISRLFGIFNEEIVSIWCNNKKSHYRNLGRPTLYIDGRHFTLDFTFEDRNKKRYIVEMKSELQYEKFKYMVLSNGSNVNYFQQHLKKKAFQLFVDPKSVDEIKIAGGHKMVRVEFHDKMKALDTITKLMGLHQDTVLHKHITVDEEIDEKALEADLMRGGLLGLKDKMASITEIEVNSPTGNLADTSTIIEVDPANSKPDNPSN